MSDAGFGTFGPANTMLLDESARSSSHPENVIEVPDWERDETGQILADVGAFVDSLLLARPVDIPEYLRLHERKITAGSSSGAEENTHVSSSTEKEEKKLTEFQ